MSEQTQSTSSANPLQDGPFRRRGSRWLIVSTVALAAALSGAVTTRAISQHAYGPSFMRELFDPARVEDRADRMTRHVAIELDATNDQQDKLRGIVKGALKDLLPMREKSLSARERAHALLTQATIDRAAIEALRVEQMALADAASKRFAQALGDAAEVLSPQQRRNLDDRINELRERWDFRRGWHRG
jgi:periplasmic protein CpxP/Spy